MSDMVLNKVKKLLNLGNSPNEHEAQIAIEKAHQLLKEYNLSIADIQQDIMYDIMEEDILESKNVSSWKLYILAGVAKANYCSLVTTKYNYKVVQQLVGKEHNILVAKEMINYLFGVVERLSKECAGSVRGDYKKGLAYRLCERLIILNKTDEQQCTALVVKEQSMINKYLQNKYDNLESMNTNVNVKNQLAFLAGVEAANSVSLHSQVNSKARTVGGYL